MWKFIITHHANSRKLERGLEIPKAEIIKAVKKLNKQTQCSVKIKVSGAIYMLGIYPKEKEIVVITTHYLSKKKDKEVATPNFEKIKRKKSRKVKRKQKNYGRGKGKKR